MTRQGFLAAAVSVILLAAGLVSETPSAAASYGAAVSAVDRKDFRLGMSSPAC